MASAEMLGFASSAQPTVLIGMQVPPKDKKAFQKFLDSLGYEYAEETGNPAYKLFLS